MEDVRCADKLATVQAEVRAVTGTMAANIAAVVDNTEKLEVTGKRAEDVARRGKEFGEAARRLRRKMWWQNCKVKLMVGAIVVTGLAVVGIIIWQATKSDGDRRRLGADFNFANTATSMLRGSGWGGLQSHGRAAGV